MSAAYVFRVAFRLPTEGVGVDPNRFETVLRVPAADPDAAAPAGPVDWLFFRDNLWRGEAGDEAHLRATASDLLGVEVVDLTFSELRTDEAYLAALRRAIEADLVTFNADDADEVLHKYLGSSIHVVDADAV